MQVKGKVQQVSGPRKTRIGSWNVGLKINGDWFNYYSRDLKEVQSIIDKFPVGSSVAIEYDETKGYSPIQSISSAIIEEQATLTGPRSGVTTDLQEFKNIVKNLRSIRSDLMKIISYLDTRIRELSRRESD